MENSVQGKYKGQDTQGLQETSMMVHQKSVVKYPNAETLVEGQMYSLQLKAKYQRGHLTFTAL